MTQKSICSVLQVIVKQFAMPCPSKVPLASIFLPNNIALLRRLFYCANFLNISSQRHFHHKPYFKIGNFSSTHANNIYDKICYQGVCHFSIKPRVHNPIKIDGNIIAQEIKDEVKAEVDALIEAGKRRPHLAVLLVGSDPASVIYVRNKAKAAQYTGISCDILRLPSSVTEQVVLREIDFLNRLPDNDGILVQLPLPQHINERTICDAIAPSKDVDGFNVLNVGRFCVDQRAFIPATPSGVLEILKRLKIVTCGKNAVVCGRSKNVGMPIALHLHSDGNGSNNTGDATTTICHRNTPLEQLKFFTKAADILVTATGVPKLVTVDMVKEGVVVIDVGISRIIDDKGKAKLVGDVDYEGVSQKASYITPVPGGVGPVTVAMNILKCAARRAVNKKEMEIHEV